MGWQDRNYAQDGDGRNGLGRPGGDWRGMRPSFDNPMSWSFWIGRAFGIDVRVHIILVLFILVQLFQSLGATDSGATRSYSPIHAIVSMGGLFVIVLMHEFGHCFACRRSGGDANEILMWPLGGLAYCMPPHRWRAHLWTVLGGPLVNVALLPVFAVPIFLRSHDLLAAMPVPFIGPPAFWSTESSFWWIAFYLVAQINLLLLLFNLLPMFPMDGGRIVQALLWPKFGYVRSMRVALRVGYIGAIGLALLGVASSDFMLVSLALFGGITCWLTHKQLQYTEEMMGFEYGEYAQGMTGDYQEAAAAKPSRRELKAKQKADEAARRDEAELDRLLEKIRRDGMDSLTKREKKWLESTSKKKQQDT